MALKVGKREKIVVGSLIGLGLILGLHVMIYSKRAKDFVEISNNWQAKKTEYSNMGSVQNKRDVDAYASETKKMVQEFNQTIVDLNLDFPLHHQNPEDKTNEQLIYKEEYDFLQKLKEMAETTGVIKYSFLGKDGWNYPTALPEPVVKKAVNLGDLIGSIKDAQEILRVISKDNFQIQKTKEAELKDLKKQVGVDVDLINGLQKYGADVPHFIMLAHAKLILDFKPEDYPLTQIQLYDHLGIQMQKYVISMRKQMQGAMDIMDRAKAAGIEDIKELYFLPEQTIYVNTLTGETAGFSEAPKTDKAKAGTIGTGRGEPGMSEPGMMPGMEPGMQPGMEPGMQPGMEPGMQPGMEPGMMPGMEPGMMPGMEPGMTGEGMAPGAGGKLADQKKGKIDTKLGNSRPIKITVSGPNLNVINFLYSLSNIKKTYEIDDLVFKATQEGRVDCTATINILTFVEKIVPIGE